MDPKANIEEQRAIAERTIARDERLEAMGLLEADAVEMSASQREGYEEDLIAAMEDASRLAELVLALDEWMRRGGFSPYAKAEPVSGARRGRAGPLRDAPETVAYERSARDVIYELIGFSTEEHGERSIRHRRYTTSRTLALAWARLPRVQFTDSGHGIEFWVHEGARRSKDRPEKGYNSEFERKLQALRAEVKNERREARQ